MSRWRVDAVCRDEDPELFHPIGTAGLSLVQIEQAKAVCRRCSVSDECLLWALGAGQDNGIWGGTTGEERRAMRRPRLTVPRPVWSEPPVVCARCKQHPARAKGLCQGCHSWAARQKQLTKAGVSCGG